MAEIEKKGILENNFIGPILGILIITIDIMFFFGRPVFIPLLVVGGLTVFSIRLIRYYIKSQRVKKLEKEFPEFIRNLVSAVKSGMPIPRAITHISEMDYGELSPHVKTLSNQIEWAIPIHTALLKFSNSTKSEVIHRAITTVIEAEKAGGKMESVLETITRSVMIVESLKEKRKAGVHSTVVQTYIIFIIFLAVMIVVQNVVIPYVTNVDSNDYGGTGSTTQTNNFLSPVSIDFQTPMTFIKTLGAWLQSIKGILLALVTIQGFFTGLVLGKLSEGDYAAGMKHALVLVLLGFVTISFFQGMI